MVFGGNDDYKTILIGETPVDTIHELYLHIPSIKTHSLNYNHFHQYHPNNFWLVIFAIGVFAAIALFVYDRLLISRKDA